MKLSVSILALCFGTFPALAAPEAVNRSEGRSAFLASSHGLTAQAKGEEDECQTSADCPDGYHCRKQADPHVCVPNE